MSLLIYCKKVLCVCVSVFIKNYMETANYALCSHKNVIDHYYELIQVCMTDKHTRYDQNILKPIIKFFRLEIKMKIRGSLNKFPDFFRMGTFIDSTHMKL